MLSSAAAAAAQGMLTHLWPPSHVSIFQRRNCMFFSHIQGKLQSLHTLCCNQYVLVLPDSMLSFTLSWSIHPEAISMKSFLETSKPSVYVVKCLLFLTTIRKDFHPVDAEAHVACLCACSTFYIPLIYSDYLTAVTLRTAKCNNCTCGHAANSACDASQSATA